MAEYLYHVTSFNPSLKAGRSTDEVTVMLHGVINEAAANGWEFYQTASVPVEVTPGCLAGLFGGRAVTAYTYHLIFRRPR